MDEFEALISEVVLRSRSWLRHLFFFCSRTTPTSMFFNAFIIIASESGLITTCFARGHNGYNRILGSRHASGLVKRVLQTPILVNSICFSWVGRTQRFGVTVPILWGERTWWIQYLCMCVSLKIHQDLTNLQEYLQVVTTAIVGSADESFFLARFFGDISGKLLSRRSHALNQVVQKECFGGNKSLKQVFISNLEQGSVIFSSPSFARCISHRCIQDRWYLTFPALWTLDPWVGPHVGIGFKSRHIGHTCVSHKFTHSINF